MNHASKLCLLATALLVPLGAMPASADDPGTCASPCTIGASTTHYDPPLVVLANNSSVVWHSTDVGHIQRETSTPVGSPAGCFTVTSPGNGNSPSVLFEVQGGVLNATSGSITRTCGNAVQVPGVGFVVAYHCTLHADMRGVIVVKA